MERCVAAIETSPECPNDAIFAAQIRLQLLAQNVVEASENLQLMRSNATIAVVNMTIPGLLHLKNLQAQLQDSKLSLAPQLQHHGEYFSSVQG